MDKSTTVQIESILNKDDGSLPFGYYLPSEEGRLTWNCGYDKEGKIISVFCYDNGDYKDKKPSPLENMEQANFAKNELIKAGWQKLKPPQITVATANGDKKPLNSKQKRYLAKHIHKLSKNDPFADNFESK